MADPTTVAGWRVDSDGHASDGGVHLDLMIGGDELYSDWCPTCHGTGLPLPVLFAMLRALGYEIRGPRSGGRAVSGPVFEHEGWKVYASGVAVNDVDATDGTRSAQWTEQAVIKPDGLDITGCDFLLHLPVLAAMLRAVGWRVEEPGESQCDWCSACACRSPQPRPPTPPG